MDATMIKVMPDKTRECRSGFKVDAKWVGTALDEILDEPEMQNQCISPKLIELKNYLRFKGNSKREDGDFSLWE